jgi:hypothetical protein
MQSPTLNWTSKSRDAKSLYVLNRSCVSIVRMLTCSSFLDSRLAPAACCDQQAVSKLVQAATGDDSAHAIVNPKGQGMA